MRNADDVPVHHLVVDSGAFIKQIPLQVLFLFIFLPALIYFNLLSVIFSALDCLVTHLLFIPRPLSKLTYNFTH